MKSFPTPDAPPAAPSIAAPQRAALRWMLRAVLGAVILSLVLSQRGAARQVGSALMGVSPLVLLFSVAFYWLGQALCVWKWQILLRARGIEASFGVCCCLYAAGMFGNLWLPGNIGGDALRAGLLSRQTRAPLSDAAASILVERLTGFGALLFLALLGLSFRAFLGRSQAQGGSLLWSALGISVGLMATWFLAGRFLANRTGKWARKLASLRDSLSFYARPAHRAVLAGSLALSLLFQVSQIVLNAALARATHLDWPLGTFFWAAPLLSLSGLIPAGIGGFGVREAAALTLLRADFPASPPGQIVAWSLLWQATVWLSSLPGALFLKFQGKP